LKAVLIVTMVLLNLLLKFYTTEITNTGTFHICDIYALIKRTIDTINVKCTHCTCIIFTMTFDILEQWCIVLVGLLVASLDGWKMSNS